MTLTLETTMHVTVRVIRLLDDHLMSNDLIIDSTIEVQATNNPELAKDRIKALRLWLDEYLNGSVIFGVGTNADTTTFETINNHLIMCPDEPHDYLLLLLIHSKMSAIAGQHLFISKTTMRSNTGVDFSNSVEGPSWEWLPNHDEWLDGQSYHEKPWWMRDDSSTMDLKIHPDDDRSKIPELGINLIDAVRSYGVVDRVQPTAEIVRPTFKPTILTPDD